MVLAVWVVVFELITCIPLFDGNFNVEKWTEQVLVSVMVAGIDLVLCVGLSVLNRFFFGEIVCVLNEDGIHHKDRLVKWNDILGVEYTVTHVARFYFRPAYVDVVCKNETIRIASVPLYMLSLAKKFNPNIKIKRDVTPLVIAAAILIIPIIISAV